MSTAKLGVLIAKILIDDETRPHFGPRDAITGKITLTYSPQTSLFRSPAPAATLFAPIKIEVTLRSKIKIIVKQERDMPVEHGCLLFLVAFPVFEGTFKAEAGDCREFPFRITFPSSVSGEAIPPTFSYYFSEFPDSVSLDAVYRVGVKLEVPGIDIKTVIPEHNSQPEIEYNLPRPEGSVDAEGTMITQKVSIDCRALLPQSKRSSKPQEKLRAVFTSSQTTALQMHCSNMERVFPGYRPLFSISLHGDSLPEVSLISFRADPVAYTWCKTDQRIKGPYERSDRRSLQRLVSKTLLPLQLSKANEHSVNLEVDAIYGWPSSFKHSMLSRRYCLRIKMKMKIGHESINFDQEYSTTLGPRPGGPELESVDENLPSYQDARVNPSSLPPNYG
ncbi:unnamed protein product [Zymoseptoria tritici ST99CH_3D1]|nr:unnamed protein product [Zymoseptoria tritici ST99CH_3D1]